MLVAGVVVSFEFVHGVQGEEEFWLLVQLLLDDLRHTPIDSHSAVRAVQVKQVTEEVLVSW